MGERKNLLVSEKPELCLEVAGIQPDDPVHYAQMNKILETLLNNDAFLNKVADKMVEKTLIAHMLDSSNPLMVLGADQAPELTRLIDIERERITQLYSDIGSKPHFVLVKNVQCGTLQAAGSHGIKTISFPEVYDYAPDAIFIQCNNSASLGANQTCTTFNLMSVSNSDFKFSYYVNYSTGNNNNLPVCIDYLLIWLYSANT